MAISPLKQGKFVQKLIAISVFSCLILFQNCGETNPENTPPEFNVASLTKGDLSNVSIVQDLSGYIATATGGCFDIEVIITGNPKSYQWLHFGKFIDGARNVGTRPTQLRICNITGPDGGEYKLRINVEDGFIDSGTVKVIVDGVLPTPPP